MVAGWLRESEPLALCGRPSCAVLIYHDNAVHLKLLITIRTLPCQSVSRGTVRLTSIHHSQIEGKFTATPGGLTSVFFMVALTGSMIELVNANIKYAVAPLEVEFAFN